MKKISIHAKNILNEALSYMKTLERTLIKKSKFSNELLYQMAAMCTEKFLVALLAYDNINATHHTPLALIKELEELRVIPETIKSTAHLVGKFESICSMSGFGYKIPNDEELQNMIIGLVEIKNFTTTIFNEALE